MLALFIRQPYVELILRGLKTIEYRSRATRIGGERFCIYVAGKWNKRAAIGSGRSATTWSSDLAMPGDGPPAWMLELANGLRLNCRRA